MKTNDTEQLQAIEGLIQEIDPNTSPDYGQDEVAVAELMGELEDREAFALAFSALTTRAQARPANSPQLLRDNPELLETMTRRFEDYEYDQKPLVETEPDRLFHANERLMEGKNPVAIIRADQYEDFDEEILQPLMSLNGFRSVKSEDFPRSANNVHGNSRVHLDAFTDRDDAQSRHFRYGLSVSRVKQGRVVAITGLAAPATKGWNETQYQNALHDVNASNVIVGLERLATDLTNPRGPAYKHWEPHLKGVRGEFVATVLNEGDVAVWPQGGAGAKLASWHGFFQIGNHRREDFTPRKSTSYHLM